MVTNKELGESLREIARLLEAQGANPFRVQAYRGAAETLAGLDTEAHVILDREGVEGLMRLPGIGESLARSLAKLIEDGRLPLLDRLRGDATAERLFSTVPGIGPELAERIHEELGIETLADLEAAAQDGRLGRIRGFGPKRLQAVRESLAGRFRRPPPASRRSVHRAPGDAPPVAEILDVDSEYREAATANRLPRIAPRRFNPTREAWLPVLHTARGERHYTALYSNTARAHELGAIRDWVVVYRDDAGGDGQWTVVTARFGRLRGRRIVRGRERECEGHYEGGPV